MLCALNLGHLVSQAGKPLDKSGWQKLAVLHYNEPCLIQPLLSPTWNYASCTYMQTCHFLKVVLKRVVALSATNNIKRQCYSSCWERKCMTVNCLEYNQSKKKKKKIFLDFDVSSTAQGHLMMSQNCILCMNQSRYLTNHTNFKLVHVRIYQNIKLWMFTTVLVLPPWNESCGQCHWKRHKRSNVSKYYHHAKADIQQSKSQKRLYTTLFNSAKQDRMQEGILFFKAMNNTKTNK